MKRTKGRMIFCITLLVLNVAFIWGNSLLPKEMSSAFSKFVGRIVNFFMPDSITVESGEGHGVLRKIAHFLEFCSLGWLLSWLVRMKQDRNVLSIMVPFVCGTAVAAVDETIQLFIPGRGPNIRDVGIDAAGVLLGVLILWLMARKKHKKKQGTAN